MSNLNDFIGGSGTLKYNLQQVLGSSTSWLDTAEQSAAFQADTVAIAIGGVARASTSTSVHFDIGANPTATTSMAIMPPVGVKDIHGNSTKISNYLIIGVNAGEKISCIRSAGYQMEAHIIELKK